MVWVVLWITGSSGESGGPEPAPAAPGVERSGVGRLDVKDGRWLGRKNGRRGPGRVVGPEKGGPFGNTSGNRKGCRRLSITGDVGEIIASLGHFWRPLAPGNAGCNA